MNSHLAFLSQVSALLNKLLDYKDALTQVAYLCVPSIADFCTVDIRAASEMERITTVYNVPDAAKFSRKMPPTQLLSRVFQTGERFLFAANHQPLSKVTARQVETFRKRGVQSLVIMPLVVNEKVLGAISLAMMETSGRSFDADDLDMMTILADQLAQVIHFSERINETQQVLEQLPHLQYQARLIESISDAIIATDMNLRIRSWNKTAEIIYGWRAEEVMGEQITALFHPSYKSQQQGEVTEEIFKYGSWSGEITQTKKGGKEIDVMMAANLLVDDNGHPVGIVATIRDITERKWVQMLVNEAHARTNQERRQLRTVLETLPVAVFLADANGRIIETNKQVSQVWGGYIAVRSIDEYQEYKGWWADTGQPLGPRDWSLSRALLKGETVIGEIIDIERFDGTRGTILNSAAPIRDAEGNIVGGVAICADLTEHKRIEEALRSSERQLRTVLENMPIMLAASDENHQIVVWNRECERVTGYLADEILGKPNVLELFFAPQNDVLASGAEYRDFELTLTRKDGAVRHVVWSNLSRQFPVPGWASWIVGVDQTARKNTERQTMFLQQLTEALSKAASVEQVSDVILNKGLAVLDGHGGLVALLDESNDTVEVINKNSGPGQVSNSFQRYSLHTLSPLTDAIRTGQPVWLESPDEYAGKYPHLVKSAGSPPIQAAAYLPLIVEEHTIGGIGINFLVPKQLSDADRAFLMALAQQCALTIERARLYNVTQQSHIEAENQRRRAVNVVESITDAFVAVDTEWRYTYINRRAEQLIGEPRELLIGERFRDLGDMEGKSLLDMARQAIEAKQILGYEAYYPVLETWFAIRLYPSPDGLSIYFADISERKYAEKQALQLAIEQEHTQVLADFVQNASHDLKTPLSTINTSLYLLKRLKDPEKQLHHINVIQRQTNRLAKLVEGLLTMTWLDREAVYSFRSINLNALVRGVEAGIRASAEEKNISVILDLAQNIPFARADNVEMGRAILELVQNAVQFTPPHGKVTIRTYAEDDHLCIEVQDTGIGVSEKDLPHIFERLYRVDKARSMETGGIGLGLSIAQKIIEAHNGRIEVSSVVGQGSMFKVMLSIVNQNVNMGLDEGGR